MPQQKDKSHSILSEIKVTKVILPTIIGLGVVFYLMFTQLDIQPLDRVENSTKTYFWISMAILMYIIRHLFYAWRLRLLTNNFFSWRKSIELIVIWEFSSCVSPTSVGGSGVALFFLSQEKLNGGKTVALVLYTLVVDTFFFLLTVPIFYVILGSIMIRPGMHTLSDFDGFGITFLIMLLGMAAYGFLFFYGLFINPRMVKRFLLLLSKIPFWKKVKENLRKTALDVVIASGELKHETWRFHTQVFVATAFAWITRFVAINFLILALVTNVQMGFFDHFLLLARGEVMHVITSFSPTPGGSGIAEYLFGGFYSDYVPKGISSLIALVWRLVTYYPYLVLGVIIIPIWIKEILKYKAEKISEDA
ncbi:MAG: lysylphosphatidylglycerol synthase transmembrane domain-containing protein [Saprospiraceae bacterium]